MVKILKIVQIILARVLEVCLPVSDMGAKGWHWLCISYVKSKPENSSRVLHSFNTLYFRSFLKGLKQALLDYVWNHSEFYFATTNEPIYFGRTLITFIIRTNLIQYKYSKPSTKNTGLRLLQVSLNFFSETYSSHLLNKSFKNFYSCLM